MVVVLSYVTHSEGLRRRAVVSALFAQGYYRGVLYTTLAHTWSLAVEEHFYFLLPPLLMLLVAIRGKREPFRMLPSLFIILAVSSLALRRYALPVSALAVHMTHMRMDSLFAGVTLRYFYDFRPALFHKLTGHYALALAFLFCLPAAVLDQSDRVMQSFGLSGLLLGFSFLVAWSVVRTPRTLFPRALSRVAARIGFYSYSIYLWHPIVGEALFHSGISVWKFWSYIAACIIGGIGMAYLVEMPYLVLRERFFPSFQSVPQLSLPQGVALPSVSSRLEAL